MELTIALSFLLAIVGGAAERLSDQLPLEVDRTGEDFDLINERVSSLRSPMCGRTDRER